MVTDENTQNLTTVIQVVTETIAPMCACDYVPAHSPAANYIIRADEIADLLTLFWNVLSLPKDPDFQGIDDFLPGIISEFSNDCSFQNAFIHFHTFAKFEQIIKHFLFHILSDAQWQQALQDQKTLAWCLVRLGMLPPMSSPDRVDLRTAQPEDYLYSPLPGYPYLEHIIRSYLCRNDESHICPKQTRATLGVNEASLWISYLYATKRFRKELSQAVNRHQLRGLARTDYCRRIVMNYNQKNIADGFKYVPLKWLHDKGLSEISIEDMLASADLHYLLHGEAGSGKSVALQRLCYHAARLHIEDPNSSIPVLITMKDLSDTTILQQVQTALQIGQEECDYILSSGHLLLLLDGINEIVSHDPKITTVVKRRRYIEEIQRILSNYPATRLVITDRYITNLGSNHSLKAYALQRITEADIRTFCLQYNVPTTVLNTLALPAETVAFLNTPIKIKMLVDLLNSGSGTVPTTRDALIGRYLRLIIDRECYEKCTLDVEDSSIFIHMLQKFSCAIAANQYVGLTYHKTVEVFANALDELYLDRSTATNNVKMATELKILECSSQNYYNFASELYQSYFYSCALADEF